MAKQTKITDYNDPKFLEWVKLRRNEKCPDCGNIPRDSLVKTTSWCPSCERVWKLVRTAYSWRIHWWYVNGDKAKWRHRTRKHITADSVENPAKK